MKDYGGGRQAIACCWSCGCTAHFLTGNRIRLINGVTCSSSYTSRYFISAAHGIPIGVPFFLWVGSSNLMAVAQFWAFANDLYTPSAATSVSVGRHRRHARSWVGARLASRLMASHAGPPPVASHCRRWSDGVHRPRTTGQTMRALSRHSSHRGTDRRTARPGRADSHDSDRAICASSR